MRWDENRIEGRWIEITEQVEARVRFADEVLKLMRDRGMPEDRRTIVNQLDWLKQEFSSLALLRQLRDGSLADKVARFAEILQKKTRYAPENADAVLDWALRGLMQFEALREHMWNARISVNFETIYPEESES